MSAISSVPGTGKVLATPPGVLGVPLLMCQWRPAGALIGLGGLLLGCSVVTGGQGMVTIAPGQVLAIRLPRVLLEMLIGAGLVVSDAAMQGLFRNPLADPGLIGVASRAALAVVSATTLHPWQLSSVTAIAWQESS